MTVNKQDLIKQCLHPCKSHKQHIKIRRRNVLTYSHYQEARNAVLIAQFGPNLHYQQGTGALDMPSGTKSSGNTCI